MAASSSICPMPLPRSSRRWVRARAVYAKAHIGVREADIVPEGKYDELLAAVTDPDGANYWDVVLDLPRTQHVQMEAVDQAYSLYEMVDGSVGTCHVDLPPGPAGNRRRRCRCSVPTATSIFGVGYTASIISRHRSLLPNIDADGWFHIPPRGDASRAKWPQPTLARSTTTFSRFDPTPD